MSYKLAICLTTFLRNDFAFETIQSLQSSLFENVILLIGDQNRANEHINLNPNWHYTHHFVLPFDCGLSYARNYLVQQANALKCDYCLITADSIRFDEIFSFDLHTSFLQSNENYGIVGFNLKNRQPWEGEIELIPNSHFAVQQLNMQNAQFTNYNNVNFYNCSVVRNFFLAKTQCLLDNPWDNSLLLCEHEDFFWRLKQTHWKVFYTNSFSANYVKSEKNQEYTKFRQRMYNEFKQILMKKYNLSTWVRYKR